MKKPPVAGILSYLYSTENFNLYPTGIVTGAGIVAESENWVVAIPDAGSSLSYDVM